MQESKEQCLTSHHPDHPQEAWCCLKRENHEDEHEDDKGHTWPNPDPHHRIRKRLTDLYMRGFRAAVSGQKRPSGGVPTGMHTSTYNRGFDAGLAVVEIAKGQAHKVAAIMVTS